MLFIAAVLVCAPGCRGSSGGGGGSDAALDVKPAPAEITSTGDIAQPGMDLQVIGGQVTVSTTKGMKVSTVGGHLFSLDTQTPEFKLPVRGSSRLELAGVLSSAEGQRRLVLREGGEETEVLPGDWFLPGIGAVGEGGTVAVCANRLSGMSTVLTAGLMPDPGAGVELVCRLRQNGTWLAPVKLKGPTGAQWLGDVVARPGGQFWIVYMNDRSGRLVTLPESGDGAGRVAFGPDGFGKPILVHSLHPE